MTFDRLGRRDLSPGGEDEARTEIMAKLKGEAALRDAEIRKNKRPAGLFKSA